MLLRMKTASLLIASPLLLVLGLVSAFQAFHGHTTFGLGYPLSQDWIDVSVKASGAWVVFGILLVLAAVVAYLWGLIKVLRPPARAAGAASLSM